MAGTHVQATRPPGEVGPRGVLSRLGARPARDGRDPRNHRPRRWWSDLLAPAAVFLASLVVVLYRTGLSFGAALFTPKTFAHWDSGHYLSIASGGYHAEWNCTGPTVHLPPHIPPGDYLCGNAGWFPGYPMAIRALAGLTGLSQPVAGLIIAWAAWFLLLVFLWKLTAGGSVASRSACLLLGGFFSGSVYFAALFPVSLCIAGMLAALWFALRSPLPAAGLLAFVAAFVAGASYLTAIVLAPALLLTAVTVTRGTARRNALLGALGSVAGFGYMLLQMQISVGIWNAYFLSAAKYGVGAHNPLDTLRRRLEPLGMTLAPEAQFLRAVAAQTLATMFFLAAMLIVVAVRAVTVRHRPSDEPNDRDDGGGYWLGRLSRVLVARVGAVDLGLVVTAVGVWMIPYIAGGAASTYRSEAFVVVGVPLLRHLPAWVIAPVVVVAGGVAWYMIPTYFKGQII